MEMSLGSLGRRTSESNPCLGLSVLLYACALRYTVVVCVCVDTPSSASFCVLLSALIYVFRVRCSKNKALVAAESRASHALYTSVVTRFIISAR
jgi:hypothetical protein